MIAVNGWNLKGPAGTSAPLYPQMPLVIFDPVLVEQGLEFFLKSAFTMMFLLTWDVLHHTPSTRLAHGERTTPFLPFEIAAFTNVFMNPSA